MQPHTAFHPLVAGWFAERFGEPTAPQSEGWPEISSGSDTLIAAPTGSGKTLAAFLWSINRLIERALSGDLPDTTQVVYVSPLKALANDIEKNLQAPLRAIRERAIAEGIDLPEIRVAVRSGDTPQSDRARMLRKPPHILITTPESLYILLTAQGSRQFLATAETVIVDEIHAVAGDKRGSHLALSLERLDALAERRLQRIGLSATQKPIEEIAALLVGNAPHPNPLPEGERGRPRAALTPRSSRLTPHASPGTPHASPLTPHASRLTPRCSIVDVGHRRPMHLSVNIPDQELGPIATHELWAEIYERIVAQVQAHRATLVFVSTRRLVERVAHQLSERLGADRVAAHHGSLSRETRLRAEQQLKSGEVPVVVATASLELGIDIGHVDLVCHIGAPRLLSTLLQRVGRSGHWLGAIPRGILYPLTRDDLVQCAAAIRAVRAGELDRIGIPENPLDILAQQMVATAASGEIGDDDLYQLVRRAYPFRNLSRDDFDIVLEMLSEGIATGRGRRSAHLHHDLVNGVVRPRRGARLAAITSGGAIPDLADYDVVEEPSGTFVGKVHEDFAVESMAGDIFLLGNQSWRIRRVETGRVRVEDAHGAPPTIPFWLGEAPARSMELSAAVSDLREEIAQRLRSGPGSTTGSLRTNMGVTPLPNPPPQGGREPVLFPLPLDGGAIPMPPPLQRGREPAPSPSTGEGWGGGDGVPDVQRNGPAGSPPPGAREAAIAWLQDETGLESAGAEAIVDYVKETLALLGTVPTQQRVVAERFFDEAGGMQLVLHSPFGGRINRAWGLSLRKRFCVTFDFELQAAATDDGIVISLGEQHSFPLDSVFHMVRPAVLEADLTQAALQSPMFTNRWRWNASRALALLRYERGRRVPMNLQRMRAEDLLAAVFPANVACQDNRTGPIVPPDHPLVNETIDNCLREAMDVDGLRDILLDIERGVIETVAVETPTPSAMSHEILNANPYAFLDDAPLEERRARAVALRRTDPDLAGGIGALDPEAIAVVRSQAWPDVRDAEELHDALLTFGILPLRDLGEWQAFEDELVAAGRASVASWPPEGAPTIVTLSEAKDLPGDASPAAQHDSRIVTLSEAKGLPGDASPGAQHDSGIVIPSEAKDLPGDASPVAQHDNSHRALVAAERVNMVRAVCGEVRLDPPIAQPAGVRDLDRDDAVRHIVQGWLEAVGPTTAAALADRIGLRTGDVDVALASLEGRGAVLRGTFTRRVPSSEFRAPSGGVPSSEFRAPSGLNQEPRTRNLELAVEWCERRLLARIHRLTLGRLRQEIEPVSAADFMRFLFRWHHLAPGSQLHGKEGVAAIVRQLQGLELPAPAWEANVLPGRIAGYDPADLEQLCLAGVVAWGRLSHRQANGDDDPTAGAAVSSSEFRVSSSGGIRSGTAPRNADRGTRNSRRRRQAPGRQAPLAFLLRDDLPTFLSPSLMAGRSRDRAEGSSAAASPSRLLDNPLTLSALRTPSPDESGHSESLSKGPGGSLRLRSGQALGSPRAKPKLFQQPAREEEAEEESPGPNGLSREARDVHEYLARRGASFLSEIARGTRQVPATVEDALWELVAHGLVTGDGIAGLRVLLQPESKRLRSRPHLRSLPGGRGSQRTMPVGRWSLWGTMDVEPPTPDGRIERLAWQFLRRYGLVFRDLLAREGQAPPWRALLPVYRRLEARGEIRGGRFVAGLVGEQYALPEAVDALRSARRAHPSGEIVLVASGDPLNLVGIITPGSRVSPFSNQVIAHRDGVPVEVGPLGAVRSRLQLPKPVKAS